MRLVLDTSVWREAARDRTWLRSAADRGHVLLAPPEAVRELAVRAVETNSDGAYEEIRVAFVLMGRYAIESLEPFEWQVARALGLDPGPRVDGTAVQSWIAGCRTREDLHRTRRHPRWVGSDRVADLGRWPAALREEKARWRESLGDSLSSKLPKLIGARRRMEPVPISQEEYAKVKGELWSDRLALARLEIASMYETLDDLPRLPDHRQSAAEAKVLEMLNVHVALQVEAILDMFDGPHNRDQPKLKFEDNDWIDLAQTRHLGADFAWVTMERRWAAIAARAGHAGRVLHPSDV